MYAQDFHSAEQIFSSVSDKLSELNTNNPEDNLKHLKDLKEECKPLHSYEGSMKDVLENVHIKNFPEYYEQLTGHLNDYLKEKEKMEKLFAKLMKGITKKAQEQQHVDDSAQVKTWPQEGEVGVQVKTWPEVETVGVQVKTWPVEETAATVAKSAQLGSSITKIKREIKQDVPLTRADIYLQQLDQAIKDTQISIRAADILSATSCKPKFLQENIVKNLALAQSSVDMVNLLKRLLTEEGTPLKEPKEQEIQDLLIYFQTIAERTRLEHLARGVGTYFEAGGA